MMFVKVNNIVQVGVEIMETQKDVEKVYVDMETGECYENPEILKDIIEERKIQKLENKNQNFIQFSQGIAPSLLRKLTKPGSAVLAYLMDNLDMQDFNTIMVSQQVIADELKMARQTVAKGVKNLEELKILAVGKIGQANVYLVNPLFAWKNGHLQKETMKLRGIALLGKAENQRIFEEFSKIERNSLKSSSDLRVKVQNNPVIPK